MSEKSSWPNVVSRRAAKHPSTSILRIAATKTAVWLFGLATLWLVFSSRAEETKTNPATASEPTAVDGAETYKKLSLAELMDVEVTLVSKRPEKLSETPSSVQVITREDIENSGATRLPEALRLASNLQVAQVNAHDWAITARGFNGAPLSNNTLADKLLVMIDGRSVYTPLFGGVFWDVQNVLLEDVERIEVVSGPGGTLWGANAVNGVINVVTKSAKETQGLYVSGAGGSFLQDWGAVRYGGSAGTNLFYRVYVQRFDQNSTDLPNGLSAKDAWDMTQSGFRLDYYPSGADTITLQGDLYSGSEGLVTNTLVDGENLLARWSHVFSEDSDLKLQAYYDRTWRNLPGSAFSDSLDTYDLDLQHRFPLGERQTIVWGAGYRLMEDSVHNGPALVFSPPRKAMELFNGFVQDETVLVHDRLKLTLGAKLEHNDFSGLEIQPSARLAWTPTAQQTIWTAISRAVRSPSRFDSDVTYPVAGDSNFTSEKVLSYELGYRVRPAERLSLSLATFYNQYDDLRSINFRPPPPKFAFLNGQRAETWGVELSANFQAFDWWRWRGGYTYLQKDITAASAGIVRTGAEVEGLDPHHQFLAQSIMDLPQNFQLDLVGRYADILPPTALPTRGVPSYFTFDARLAWHIKNWELSVVGQNLWDNAHSEFGTQIPRSIYGKVAVRL